MTTNVLLDSARPPAEGDKIAAVDDAKTGWKRSGLWSTVMWEKGTGVFFTDRSFDNDLWKDYIAFFQA